MKRNLFGFVALVLVVGIGSMRRVRDAAPCTVVRNAAGRFAARTGIAAREMSCANDPDYKA